MLLSRLIAAQRSWAMSSADAFASSMLIKFAPSARTTLSISLATFQKSCVLFMILLSNRAGSSGAQFERANFLRVLGDTPRMTFRVTGTLNESPHHCGEFIVRCSHCHRRQSFNHADQGDFLRVCQRLVSVNFRLFAVFCVAKATLSASELSLETSRTFWQLSGPGRE